MAIKVIRRRDGKHVATAKRKTKPKVRIKRRKSSPNKRLPVPSKVAKTTRRIKALRKLRNRKYVRKTKRTSRKTV